MEKFVLKALREEISKQRGRTKFTQEDMGRLVGVSDQQYRKYEKGQIDSASDEALRIYLREAKAVRRPDLARAIEAELKIRAGERVEPVRSQAETIELIYQAVVSLRQDFAPVLELSKQLLKQRQRS